MLLKFKLIKYTNHKYVICVWNLATSSEELTKIIKLRYKETQVQIFYAVWPLTLKVLLVSCFETWSLPVHVCRHILLQE